MVMSINPYENRNVLRVPFKISFYVKDTKRKFVKFVLNSKDLCLRRWRYCAINDFILVVGIDSEGFKKCEKWKEYNKL